LENLNIANLAHPISSTPAHIAWLANLCTITKFTLLALAFSILIMALAWESRRLAVGPGQTAANYLLSPLSPGGLALFIYCINRIMSDSAAPLIYR